MENHVKMSYNEITSYIYLGTNDCCMVHFKEELLEKGIKGNISLEKERIDNPLGIDFFLWLPVPDLEAPTYEQFVVGVKFLNSLVEQKIKTYVHCINGHGRSPSLVIAYLISKGMEMDEAIEFVREKRPEIHLTLSQEKGLKNFVEKINK